jgi:hypothetical protein
MLLRQHLLLSPVSSSCLLLPALAVQHDPLKDSVISHHTNNRPANATEAATTAEESQAAQFSCLIPSRTTRKAPPALLDSFQHLHHPLCRPGRGRVLLELLLSAARPAPAGQHKKGRGIHQHHHQPRTGGGPSRTAYRVGVRSSAPSTVSRL